MSQPYSRTCEVSVNRGKDLSWMRCIKCHGGDVFRAVAAGGLSSEGLPCLASEARDRLYSTSCFKIAMEIYTRHVKSYENEIASRLPHFREGA